MKRYSFLLLLFMAFNYLQAGDELVSSERPKVWENAALNTVVLEYTLTGGKLNQLSAVGEELSLLLHRNLLYSVIQYGSVGANQIKLNGTPEQNLPDNIYKKLIGILPGASQTVKPGSVLVFLWGRIYEEKNDIYVQSFLRFVRNGISEKIEWNIKDFDGRSLQLLGALPTQAVAFAPRKLSLQTMQNIESEFDHNALVRESPNVSSRGYPISRDFFQSNAYRILNFTNGWMEIEPYSSGKRGWVRTGVNLLEKDIRHYLPELYFAEAVAGYLRYLMSLNQNNRWPIKLDNVIAAIDHFETAGKSVKLNDTPLALLKIIKAHIYYLSNKVPYSDTIKLLKKAASISPGNANVANLLICSQMYDNYKKGWDKTDFNDINSRLVKILSIAPDNYTIMKNLESYYQLAGTYTGSGLKLSKAEIGTKLERVSKIRAALEK